MAGASNSKNFRETLGNFATGVVIVSTLDGSGAIAAMTISSFNSVSLDPPLVLFSIARQARSFETFMAAKVFGVSVLHAGQAEISSRFGKPAMQESKSLDWTISESDVPLVPDALALFECERYATNDGGDHVIVVGRVIRHHIAHDRLPLLFFRGDYHAATRIHD